MKLRCLTGTLVLFSSAAPAQRPWQEITIPSLHEVAANLKAPPREYGAIQPEVRARIVRDFDRLVQTERVPDRGRTFRTPDVVEFAVSPQVGQAVLAFARSYSNSGPDSVRADKRHRLPHLRSSRHGKEWLSPFSRQAEIAGRHQEF
jgi:hypothetical protein